MTDHPHTRATLIAPFFMVVSMGLYVANDAVVKLLGRELPLGQLIALRGFVMIALLLAFILVLPGHGPRALGWLKHKSVLIRSAWDTFVTYTYLSALMHMPIANILAIINLAPLVILPLAAWRLGERLRFADMLAVLGGLIGALLVVRPGPEGFNWWAVSAFAAMLGIAGRDMSTRNIPPAAPSMVVALANIAMVQVVALPLWAWQGGAEVSAAAWAGLALAAAFLSAAMFALVLAVRAAPLSVSAPWRYSVIIWGVLAGWLAFGEWPDALTFLGIGIIVLSSLYATLRG